ncbi:MAG: HAD-IG family 5'-nucleotidase [Myxococcales bacterium]|jgi:HAD superfamily 5'-nucleotidase-like hydrolase
MQQLVDPDGPRGVFCNRTLNMRSIRAVGCDMDYTLVHYDVGVWERRAYEHASQRLSAMGHPLGELRFAPDLFTRGLILDLELGNVVKANRFGYVTRASHGTGILAHDEQRAAYSRVWVDLSEPRWVFLNTLFSLSEACLYAQLVDVHDAGELQGVHGYGAVYELCRAAIDATHLEGELKAEIVADPERFVVLDAELPVALLDLKHAGKKLMVITNSEWSYTRDMMAYSIDRFLPDGMTWRQLFDVVIVQAAKPGFFEGSAPLYRVVDEEGLLRPHRGPIEPGVAYLGGHARLVEESLSLSGDEILYVGDHVYADIHVSSQIRRWRTALVLRELEEEVAEQRRLESEQRELEALMREKVALEREHARLRLCLQRVQDGYAEAVDPEPETAAERIRGLRSEIEALDARIGPLAVRLGGRVNARWGPLMRAGNDKSRLARQIERHADVYMSRVSNLLHVTPFAYLRAKGGSLPHDG